MILRETGETLEGQRDRVAVGDQAATSEDEVDPGGPLDLALFLDGGLGQVRPDGIIEVLSRPGRPRRAADHSGPGYRR